MSTKTKITANEMKIDVKQSKLADPVSRVRVEGEGRDEAGNLYITIGIRKRDTVLGPYSMKELIQNKERLFTELSNAGVSLLAKKAQADLVALLQARVPGPDTFEVATGLGWHGRAFVLPGEIIGKTSKLKTAFGNLDAQMLSKYRVRGDLKKWKKKIAKPCQGNSRLMFAVSLGFTGPILRLVKGPRSGGFQIFGAAESGKTTAAMVAGSVWGCHRDEGKRENGFAESWHSTAAKIEITALAHNNTILILDETKRAGRTDSERIKVVLDVTVGLAEHREKDRLNNSGPTRSWRLYFLSTSNYSLTGLAKLGKAFIDDAERGRLVDIPLPINGHGLYEDLHGLKGGADFTNQLKARCRRYYGSAGPSFVERLIEDIGNDPTRLRAWLEGRRKAYLVRLRKEADGLRPLERATERFATVFAASSLAIKYGILPWSRKKLLAAILACQLDGLRHVEDNTLGPTVADLRAKLAQYLADNRRGFMDLFKRRPKLGRDGINGVPGYRETRKGRRWIYLTSTCVDQIIGRVASATELKQALVKEGLLAKTIKNRFVVQRRILKGGKGNKNFKPVYAFRAKLAKEATTA